MHKKYKTRIGAAMEEFLDLQRERSFCAADACHYMEQREIAVNITTVYRHLEQLVKDGILVKFKTADSDNQRYRLAGDVSRCQRHLHLQCRRCGRIQHMECSFMDEIYLDAGSRVRLCAGLRDIDAERSLSGVPRHAGGGRTVKMRERIRRAALLFAGMLLLGGCGRMAEIPDPDRLQVVCTTYPQYSYLQAIIGEVSDSVELTLIMDDGADLHSYQPVALDLVRIASADLLVYIGGESDTWVEDAATEAVNPDMRMVSLMELAGERAKEEEVVEGMQERRSLTGHDHGHEHGDEDDHAHEDGAEEEIEYDEHVWLSLKNSVVFVDALAEQLEELDAEHAETYRANADAYIAQLEELDREYEEAVAGAGVRTLIFGDPFPVPLSDRGLRPGLLRGLSWLQRGDRSQLCDRYLPCREARRAWHTFDSCPGEFGSESGGDHPGEHSLEGSADPGAEFTAVCDEG